MQPPATAHISMRLPDGRVQRFHTVSTPAGRVTRCISMADATDTSRMREALLTDFARCSCCLLTDSLTCTGFEAIRGVVDALGDVDSHEPVSLSCTVHGQEVAAAEGVPASSAVLVLLLSTCASATCRPLVTHRRIFAFYLKQIILHDLNLEDFVLRCGERFDVYRSLMPFSTAEFREGNRILRRVFESMLVRARHACTADAVPNGIVAAIHLSELGVQILLDE